MPEEDLVAERKAKLEELAALGVHPYNTDFHPDASFDTARKSLEEFEAANPDAHEHEFEGSPAVKVAGRIMQLRLQGKSCFAHVEDMGERMQVWMRLDRIGEQAFEVVKLFDLGDIVGIDGHLMRTRRGEATVLADSLTLLVKSLRPLPEKYHGLQDQETRYRKRYLDLLSSERSRSHFRKRSEITRSVRRTLDELGFLEVETPMLLQVPGLENARPFMAHWNALDSDVHLRISIELYLKRLLVGGYPRVYEMGRIFRNEGLSPRHNPEFTMLEAYQAYGDYNTMRELTEAIVVNAATAVGPVDAPEEETTEVVPSPDPLDRVASGKSLNLHPPFRTATMVELVSEHCGFNAVERWDNLADEAQRLGVSIQPDWTAGEILLEIYEQKVEHTLWDPTFVLDYPADVSPLARRRKDNPNFVERWELIVAGRELANAFSELNDPIDQRRRFEAQAKKRKERDPDAPPVDEDFLEAIELGMPPAGGVGIGIDRLAMFLLDSPAIRDVLLFPTMRPQAREATT